jgi:hypothetical protein
MREELDMFHRTGNDKDRWILVRKCFVAIAFCEEHRGDELRRLKLEDVRPSPKGYKIKYLPAKQRGHAKTIE